MSNIYSDANKGGAVITEITGRFARHLVPDARLVLITVSSGHEEFVDHRLAATLDNAEVVRIRPMLRTPGGFRTIVGILQGGAALLAPRIFAGSAEGYSEVAAATMVISKGGYLFGNRSGARSLMGLVATSFPLLFALRIGVPTVAYSTSVGPFSGRVHRWIVGNILRRLSVVAVRDIASERRAMNLGVPRERLICMPDCVFSWDQRHREFDESSDRSFRLAVVLRDVEPIREFLPVLESLMVQLAEGGVFTTFEGVVQSLGDRAITEHFVDRLRARGLNGVMAGTSELAPSELLGVYGRSAATITARLHGAILSILAGTPAVSLAVDPKKAEEVMAGVGLGDWVVPPTGKDSVGLYRWLVDAKQPDVRINLKLLVEEAAQRVDEAESAIESLLRPAVDGDNPA